MRALDTSLAENRVWHQWQGFNELLIWNGKTLSWILLGAKKKKSMNLNLDEGLRRHLVDK